MAISPRTSKKLVACLGVAIVTGALGAGFSVITGGQVPYGLLAGLQIGLLLSGFELFFVQSAAGTDLSAHRLARMAYIPLGRPVPGQFSDGQPERRLQGSAAGRDLAKRKHELLFHATHTGRHLGMMEALQGTLFGISGSVSV